MYKKLALVAALALSTAPGLSAQITTSSMTFNNPGSIADGHYYVGNYQGTRDGAVVTLNCVDFFHEVSVPDAWNAYITPLTGGDLSHTRMAGDPNALSTYEKAAFLTTQYAGASNSDVINIQHAIWRLFGDVGTAGAYFTGAADPSNYWLSFAESNYATANIAYQDFRIVTDVRLYDNANNPNFNQSVVRQEFLISTPEPSSMALLGTGLFGLVPIIRRKRLVA